MQNLKAPFMLLLSCLFAMLVMKVAFHLTGYDQHMRDAAAAAQPLGDAEASAELLAREYERSHPGKKLDFKQVPKPARTSGSFDDDDGSDSYYAGE